MFCLSFVVVTVRARLAGLDDNLEQAAMDLYATPSQTFWRVTFPLVFPGILGAALLSFSLSFDDFIITNLNAGNTMTFPMFVWGAAQRGVPMQVNVVGTVMFVISVVIVVGAELQSRRTDAQADLSSPSEAAAPPPKRRTVLQRPAVHCPEGGQGAVPGRSAPLEPVQRSEPALSSTTRRICSISSKCSWSQISGGESWMTGSPRSSARQ